jgi:hypothetical protein
MTQTLLARIMERGPGYCIIRVVLDDQMALELDRGGENAFVTIEAVDGAIHAMKAGNDERP